MTTTAVIVVLAVLAAAAIALVLLRRRTATARVDPELVREIRHMRSKMDELADELAEALERAERESRRSRLFGELGGSVDLEDIMERVLDAALEIPGFDAGLMVVEGHAGGQTVTARGLTETEKARPPTSGVATLPGTVTVTYRYGGEREPNGKLIRGGVFIPLVGRELRPIGTLSLFWRDPGRDPSAEDIEAAETIAESAMPAIESARRYGEARELAETDSLTGLYNQRYFHDTLRREVTRAHRYGRKLALLVFDLDDFKAINDRHGHPVGDRVIAQAADRLREAVRSVDTPCRFGGDEFGVILPESSAGDAEQLYRRLKESMRGTAIATDDERLSLSAGVAELQHGDTPASFFERADTALYRAKALGGDTVVVAAE